MKSKVLVSGMVGWGGVALFGGRRKLGWWVSPLDWQEKQVGREVRPVAGGVGCWKWLTLDLREL